LKEGNGKLLCPVCKGELHYQFTRTRRIRFTAEGGPIATTIDVVVGRCPKEGQYRTNLSLNLVKHKHYSYEEIQMVLEGKEDYSLACERTKAYWRHWYKNIWNAVIAKIIKITNNQISVKIITTALQKMLKGMKSQALRYVLELYNSDVNNLCTFFVLQNCNVHPRGEIIPRCVALGGIHQKIPAPGG